MSELTGILLMDKPQGFTSFDVVAKMRGIARTKKIGHAGTLDPMATGVLPLFLGRATKLCDILPRQDKAYLATFRLGLHTDTQDITGAVLKSCAVTVSPEEVFRVAESFLGEGLQVPPMYSAVRQDGKRLYELARQGLEVERRARPIVVHSQSCHLLSKDEPLYEWRIHCGKGTFVRTLVSDLGARLGCGAVLTELRRTMAAGYPIEDCFDFDAVQAAANEGRLETLLRPMESAFASLPKARLDEEQTFRFTNGVRLPETQIAREATDGIFAVYGMGKFLGTAKIENTLFCMEKLLYLQPDPSASTK